MKKYKCCFCGKEIKDRFFFANENGSSHICKQCGLDNQKLIFSEVLDCFLLESDYEENYLYLDDEVSDIEKFEVVCYDNRDSTKGRNNRK